MSSIITLDVSGHKYRTSRATLLTSPYFESLLARWSDCADKQPDGSYFVDADPDTFQHVLDFMRRPTKFPLFWSKDSGFDYALYNKLEVEADFFLLHDLRDWIRSTRYLEAVKTVVRTIALDTNEISKRQHSWREGADIQVETFFGSYSGRRHVHSACILHEPRFVRGCEYCEPILLKHGPVFDEPPKMLTQVVTKVVFDQSVCENKMAPSRRDG